MHYALQRIFWTLCFVFAMTRPVSAETLYAKTDDTKVMEQESARSKVVASLSAGAPVEVIVKGKQFYKVGLSNGKQGWIFKFKLSQEAPAKGSGGSGFGEVLGGRQVMAARESSSGSSIRGLSPASQTYAKNKGLSPVAVQAVSDMENYRLPPKDLDAFMKEGQLGEYAQ